LYRWFAAFRVAQTQKALTDALVKTGNALDAAISAEIDAWGQSKSHIKP